MSAEHKVKFHKASEANQKAKDSREKRAQREEDASYLRRSAALRLMRKAALTLAKVHKDVALTITNPYVDKSSPIDIKLSWEEREVGKKPGGVSSSSNILEWNEATISVRRSDDEGLGRIEGIALNALIIRGQFTGILPEKGKLAEAIEQSVANPLRVKAAIFLSPSRNGARERIPISAHSS